MKIYTKTGDNGTTQLADGTRLPKHNTRVDAYGNVDELNSYLGLLRSFDEEMAPVVIDIQQKLFAIATELAKGNAKNKQTALENRHIAHIEKKIDQMQEQLPPMKSFIIPGGNQAISHCHIARCVCRRAERSVSLLASQEEVNPFVIKYLNRLSDFLFVLARFWAKKWNSRQINWKVAL